MRARIGRLWGWGRGRRRAKESLGSLSVNHRSLHLRHTVQAESEPGLSQNKGQEAEAGGDTISDRRALHVQGLGCASRYGYGQLGISLKS